MNKAAFVDAIAEAEGWTKADALASVNAVVGAVKAALEKGGKVELAGFGSFSTYQTSPRMALNPSTREPVAVPAKTVIKFRAGAGFVKAVQGAGDAK